MKSLLHFALLAFLASGQHSAAAQDIRADKRFSGLDSSFDRVLKEWRAVGFAVAVVEKNKIIYARGFGFRDREKQLLVTPRTDFAIGSCTKAFTASLIGMLAAEGKLDLDKPVRNYLPELRFFNDELNQRVTLRDMMCHRTGLPRHDFSWYYFPSPSRDTLIRRIQFMEPSAGLREKWQYNNFMFMAQGAVVEKITGRTWEANLQEKILGPLGMDSSNSSLEQWMKYPNAAKGYEIYHDSLIRRSPYYNISGMAPAGSINSNVLDMSAWIMTWLNGGKFKDHEVLPATYIRQALGSQMAVSADLPDPSKAGIQFANYGFGWVLSSYKGHYRADHSGNIDGFSANTCLFPLDSIGVVVLVNQDGSAVPSIIRNLLVNRILGLPYFDWQTDIHKSVLKARFEARLGGWKSAAGRVAGTHPSHPLDAYTGIYRNEGYGAVQIRIRRDSLFAQLGSQHCWLRHYHYDFFEPLEIDPVYGIDSSGRPTPMEFRTGPAGDIAALAIKIEPSLLGPVLFTRIPAGQPGGPASPGIATKK